MAQQLTLTTQHHLFASMLLQLSDQSKEHKELEGKIKNMSRKLAHAHREISAKSKVIDSLEVDIEHLIDQLSKIRNRNSNEDTVKSRWIHKNSPGLDQSSID